MTTSTPSASARAWILPVHVASAALIMATWTASIAVLPVIAENQFDVKGLKITLITAAPTASYITSIFFNHYFARRSFGAYLIQFWLVASAPLIAMGFAGGYWAFFLPFLVACIGGAGYHPVAGELLKRLYPDRIRGRAYATVWGCTILLGSGVGWLIGEWLKVDKLSFRVFVPLIAAAHAVGLAGFYLLWRVTGQTREIERSGSMVSVIQPVLHMGRVLKADPTFAKYEASYMAYGIGWMICWAILPIMATTKLGLEAGSYAHVTQVPYALALAAAMLPAGLLMDKIGAIRSTALSFALLAIYPIGLMLTTGTTSLLWVSAFYGVAHAGANMGWMLGPVSLAPSRDKVAQYVAIHSTLVGLRGGIFQFLGVGLYQLTGQFWMALAIAAGGFALSAWQMVSLHRSTREPKTVKVVESAPQDAAAKAPGVGTPATMEGK